MKCAFYSDLQTRMWVWLITAVLFVNVFLYLRERHCWGPISQIHLRAPQCFPFPFLWLVTHVCLSYHFSCSVNAAFWDLPPLLSCLRDQSGEGVSECAPSQWVTLTQAIADKRAALICTQEVIMKHSPTHSTRKPHASKCCQWAWGHPSRENHDTTCSEGP